MIRILAERGGHATEKNAAARSERSGTVAAIQVLRLLVGQLLNRARDHYRTVRRWVKENEPNNAQRNRLRTGKIGKPAEIDEVCEVSADDGQRLRKQHTSDVIIVEGESTRIAGLNLRASDYPRATLALTFEHDAVDVECRWIDRGVQLAAHNDALAGQLAARTEKQRRKRGADVGDQVLFTSVQRDGINLAERRAGKIGKLSSSIKINLACLSIRVLNECVETFDDEVVFGDDLNFARDDIARDAVQFAGNLDDCIRVEAARHN